MGNSYEDVEAKFGMVELLLGGQGKKDVMRFKKIVTKGLVASYSTASIVIPRGIMEDSFQMILVDKFKNQTFKNFAARQQANYLQKNLHNPMTLNTKDNFHTLCWQIWYNIPFTR